MKKILLAIVKFIMLRSHGKNRLVKYRVEPWFEIPSSRRTMIAMLKDGRVI